MRLLGGLGVALAMLAPGLPAGAQAAAPAISLTTVSNRPTMVSGGDVLVRMEVPVGIAPESVRVELNGRNVTDEFQRQGDTRTFIGFMQGLSEGANTLVARGEGGARTELAITNYPITGPIFSGPQEEPFVCMTETFRRGSLGAPLDEDCSIYPQAEYRYKSTDGSMKILQDPTALPADVAQTTVLTGATVPFVVRLETGTINRAIYETAVLFDPTQGQSRPRPTVANPGWNRRLVYTFGGGCRAGWYQQGETTGGVLDELFLSRGYAVASASLNVFGNNCSDLLAAETAMMVKEHVVETYGVPRFTIGWGCSGGSYQSHQIADNYPGILDGIVVGCSFPDVTSVTNFTLMDARLLEVYFTKTAPDLFTREQQRAVSGFGQWGGIPNLSEGAKRLDPDAEFNRRVPPEARYNPDTNPRGARGTVYDHTVNAYGRDPATGFALRPLDNVGIQYGLAALNAGTISKEQFLDLNERIGGLDRDANQVPQRTVADSQATRAAYETGRILSGAGGLRTTPIIDQRSYTDDMPNGDIHMRIHGFSTRQRLIRNNGNADNQVMLVQDFRGARGFFSTQNPVLRDALGQMDRWLVAIQADTSATPQAQKVVGARPADLQDACWTAQGEKIVEKQTYDGPGRCNQIFPSFPTPRQVAGGPLDNDIVKCQLKPINLADYAVSFTPAEQARLQRTFPGGVCNWAVPGVDQRPLRGTWLSFGR